MHEEAATATLAPTDARCSTPNCAGEKSVEVESVTLCSTCAAREMRRLVGWIRYLIRNPAEQWGPRLEEALAGAPVPAV